MPGPRGRTVLLALMVGSLLLAAFPWAYAFEVVGPPRWYWAAWSIGVGGQCLVLLRWRQYGRLIALTSLLAILGLWVVHGLIVYGRIIEGHLNVDLLLVSIWISAAARDLLVPPANGPFAGVPYFAYYLDPIVPLLDRLLGLTDSPFRLLAFQAVAALSPSLAVWALAVRNPRLAPFQLALPAAYLLHPALFAYVQQDYHATAIASLPILLGCLLFFRGQVGRAYPLLVLGALTKLSYWITWPAFALVALVRRRWLAMVAYGATPLLAALAFWLLQPAGQGVPSSVAFLFGATGGGSADGSAAILQSLLELAARSGPRLWFFVLLVAGFGFVPLLAPLALLPAAPLALVALAERTGLRTLLLHQYASEYLGFLLAASVLGLLGASTRVRVGAAVALTGGMLVSSTLLVPTGQPIYGYGVSLRQSFSNALATRPAYETAVAFTACAVAGQPALWAASQTDLVSWGGYPRPPFDGLWIDQAPLGLAFIDDAFYTIPPDQWATFETLVYVSDPEQRASLARFPQMNGLRHQAEYASLLQRLPVEVTIDRGWTYRGGERLAACATQYGYPSRTVRTPAPPINR